MPGRRILSKNMRFATKFDRWLVVLLVLAGALTGVIMPAMRLFAPDKFPVPLPVAFAPLVIWIVALTCTLPQYYEVTDGYLFLRQGWRKTLLSHASLVEVEPMQDSRSAAVFSTDRILIVADGNKRFLIAPADQERFIDAVAQRAPQLERKGFGLALPFSTPN